MDCACLTDSWLSRLKGIEGTVKAHRPLLMGEHVQLDEKQLCLGEGWCELVKMTGSGLTSIDRQ